MQSGALLRLTFCLVLLHGCGHVSSEEVSGRTGENDATEWNEQQLEGIGGAVDRVVRKVVKDHGRKVEGDGRDPEQSATGDARTTELVAEGAGEVVDEAGEIPGKVGECVGRRFKKCR